MPYAYVGPWTVPTGSFWNAPFGALYPLDRSTDVDGLAKRIVDFFERGRRRIDEAAMTTAVDESGLIAALRDGDETVFAQLVDQHTPSMLRVARGYVPSREIAEEVVQETWIALVKGIAGFEGRSSLRTWLFSVMINIAKARGMRERRDADAAIAAYTGGTVDPARFRGTDDPYPGHWKPDDVPSPFPDTPEGSVLGMSSSM